MRMYADHIVFFPLTRYGYHRHLHSFPTRRSSDLSERSTRPTRSAGPVRPEARRDNSRSRRWCLLPRREQHQRCPVRELLVHGIEAGNDGVGEPWPTRQYNAYVALCGELARAFDLPVSRIMGHKQIAQSRKIDPTFNMGQFRSRVTQYLKKPYGGGSAAPSTPEYYEDYPMLLPAGGKLKKGGATALRWETVTVPVLREHDLIIACRTGVHIGTINTWKYITKNQAEQRWGVSNKRPGGVGALTKNAWVHGNTALSLIVPRGVGVLHIAYAAATPVSVTFAPRK